MTPLNDTDTFLVNRSGKSYQVKTEDLNTKVADSDLLLVNRSDKSYKITGADFKDSLGQIITPSIISPTDGAGLTLETDFIDTVSDYEIPGGWNEPSLPAENIAYNTAYGRGVYVTVVSGDTHPIRYSTDCENWTVSNCPQNQAGKYMQGPIYSGYVFIIIVNDNEVYTSEDGANWVRTGTFPATPMTGAYHRMAAANGKVWASASTGIYVTLDHGTTWIACTNYAAGSQLRVLGVAFGKNTYVGSFGYSGSYPNVCWSSDGISWQRNANFGLPSTSNNTTGVCFFKGNFYVAVTNRVIYTSPDGRQWQGISGSPTKAASLTEGNGLLYAASTNSSTGIKGAYSTDGSTWIDFDDPYSEGANMGACDFHGNRFIWTGPSAARTSWAWSYSGLNTGLPATTLTFLSDRNLGGLGFDEGNAVEQDNEDPLTYTNIFSVDPASKSMVVAERGPWIPGGTNYVMGAETLVAGPEVNSIKIDAPLTSEITAIDEIDKNWTGINMGSGAFAGYTGFNSVNFGNDTFVAFGKNGTPSQGYAAFCSWSTDGENWTMGNASAVTGNRAGYGEGAFGNGWFAAGALDVLAISNDNGRNFSKGFVAPAGTEIYQVYFAKDTWYLCTTTGLYFSNSTPQAFVKVNGYPGINSMVYNPDSDTFVLVDNAKSIWTGASPTAYASMTRSYPGFSNQASQIAYANGMYVFGGVSAVVNYKSIGWTTDNFNTINEPEGDYPTGTIESIKFCESGFVATWGWNIARSPDGITWVNEQVLPNKYLGIRDIAYGKDKYVMAGNQANSVEKGAIATELFDTTTITFQDSTNLNTFSNRSNITGLTSKTGAVVIDTSQVGSNKLKVSNQGFRLGEKCYNKALASESSSGLEIKSSDFATDPPNAMPHTSSDWQITTRDDTGYAGVVDSSSDDASSLTTWTPSNLEGGTSYRCRVRHNSDSRKSEWSPSIVFRTSASNVGNIAQPGELWTVGNPSIAGNLSQAAIPGDVGIVTVAYGNGAMFAIGADAKVYKSNNYPTIAITDSGYRWNLDNPYFVIYNGGFHASWYEYNTIVDVGSGGQVTGSFDIGSGLRPGAKIRKINTYVEYTKLMAVDTLGGACVFDTGTGESKAVTNIDTINLVDIAIHTVQNSQGYGIDDLGRLLSFRNNTQFNQPISSQNIYYNGEAPGYEGQKFVQLDYQQIPAAGPSVAAIAALRDDGMIKMPITNSYISINDANHPPVAFEEFAFFGYGLVARTADNRVFVIGGHTVAPIAGPWVNGVSPTNTVWGELQMPANRRLDLINRYQNKQLGFVFQVDN